RNRRHRGRLCGGLPGSCFSYSLRCIGVFELPGSGFVAAKAARKAFRMKEAILSNGLFVAKTTTRERLRPEVGSFEQAEGWNPEDFAREQIRGLVRQLFLSSIGRPVRQVVFRPT